MFLLRIPQPFPLNLFVIKSIISPLARVNSFNKIKLILKKFILLNQ